MPEDTSRRDVPERTVSENAPEEYVVGFSPGGGVPLARSMADAVAREIDLGEVGTVVVGRFSDRALDRLRGRSDVRYVERDRRTRALEQTTPWGISKINADTARSEGDSASSVHVAILDSGVDSDHPDLNANVGDGKAYVECGTTADGSTCSSNAGSCDRPWDDDDGHGTHVAGTVAAEDNTDGVLGAAPTTTLHAVKVLDCNGFGRGSDLASGITYVADQGWDVANMSLGSGLGDNGEADTSSAVTDAVAYAANRDVLMVAAAGNDGNDPACDDGQCVQYPAKYSEVIAVSALKQNDSLANYSSRGEEIELGAPGGDFYSIYSTYPTESGSYDYKIGTSMASPHVAGAAALTAGAVTLWNSEGVRSRLAATAADVGLSSDKQGNGRVDAAAATPGTTEWSVDVGARFQHASPAVGSSRVFVGGLGSALHALRKSDGSVDWGVDRSGTLADSSPTMSGGTVFVGSGGGVVYALDAADGTEIWSVPTDSAHVSSPTVAGGVVYVGSNDGTVLALDESNGDELRRTDVGGPVYSKPVVASGAVYVTTADGDLVALDDGNRGAVLWRFDAGAGLGHAGPAVSSSRVFVPGDRMYARDAADGSGIWSTPWGGPSGSSPVYDSGTVYVGSADGNVYAFDDGDDGSQLWSYATGGPVGGTPVVTGSGVLVGSDDGELHLVDATSGLNQDSLSLGRVRSTPAVDGDATFVTTWGGIVEKISALLE